VVQGLLCRTRRRFAPICEDLKLVGALLGCQHLSENGTRVDIVRVDICYRPLRIGWVIGAGDIEAFRRAVQLSYALWGGRFNPILIADREEETKSLVDLFRVDVLWPIG
jgi:hypothetical protein